MKEGCGEVWLGEVGVWEGKGSDEEKGKKCRRGEKNRMDVERRRKEEGGRPPLSSPLAGAQCGAEIKLFLIAASEGGGGLCFFGFSFVRTRVMYGNMCIYSM